MSQSPDHSGKGSTASASTDEMREALRDYMRTEWPRVPRQPKHNVETWTVTDDWPERVPVTEAEVRVFEAWFGDVFDEIFGPI